MEEVRSACWTACWTRLNNEYTDREAKVRAEFERRYATGEADPKKCAEASRKAFRRTMAGLPPQFATETRDSQELIWKID
jgi:hypothetical protein